MEKRIKIVPEITVYNTWRVRWSQGGKRRSKTFLTKALALVYCRDINRGIFPCLEEKFAEAKKTSKSVQMTFSDLADKFMKNHVMVHSKPATQRKYEMQLRNQIIPHLGTIKSADLHLTDLDELAAKLASMKRQKGELDRSVLTKQRNGGSKEKALSAKWQRDCLCLVLSIIKYCYEREYIERNPFRKFRLQKIQQCKVEYLSGEEVEKFLNWCDAGGPYKGLSDGNFSVRDRPMVTRFTPNIERDTEIFRYALHTGSRLGEILGLKRKAIDFDNGLVWISEIYDQTAAELASRTKGGNVRCVEMDDVTGGILNKRRNLSPEDLIFGNVGHPMWMDQFYIYCNRAGIKQVSFHAFRHTFASTMALFTPPAVLQQMLGHASWATTMKYVHIAQSNVIGYAKYLEGMYKKHRDIQELASLTLNKPR